MTSENLVIIDNSIPDYQTIINALNNNTKYILFDALTDTYDTLKTKISELSSPIFSSVGIIQHNLGGRTYRLFRNSDANSPQASTLANVSESDPNLDTWTDYQNFITYLKDEYSMENFDLMACALYSDPDWKYVIDTLETRTGVNIRASKDDTGSANLGGNWFLETDSVNLKDVYFTDAIDGFGGLFGLGVDFTVVIGTNGSIYGTGYNPFGQLGDGTTTNRNTLTAMSNTYSSKTPKSVQVGAYHTVVLMTDGSIYATGYNNEGQLGNGTLINSPTLTEMTRTNWSSKTPKSISCGWYHTVVLMTDGTIYGTGQNDNGQLGDETTSDRYTLTLMTNNTGKTPKSISCGGGFTIVIMTDGAIYGTGYNGMGGLGLGDGNNRSILTAMSNTYSSKTPKSAACGDYFTVVLMTDGTIYGTGHNANGQLGDLATGGISTLTVMTNNTGKTPKSIFSGAYHTTVLMTDGSIYGTGNNSYGQLGVGDTNQRTTLTQMTNTSGKTPQSICCGYWNTFAIMTDGTIYGTGYNTNGTLGLGDNNNRSTLTALSGTYSQLANQQEEETRITIPDFYGTYGKFTSGTSFTLSGWTLYASGGTYGNEGLCTLLTSGNSDLYCGFLIDNATIGLDGPTPFKIDNIVWDRLGGPGPYRKVQNYNIYGSNTSYSGNLTRSNASSSTLLASGTFSSSSGSVTITISNPNYYSSYYFDLLNNYGDSSVKVTGITINLGAPSNTVLTNSTSVSSLYSFTSHTFTNAGATGKTGPALSTVRSAYSSASWAQDTTNNYLNMTGDNGIQLWKVPATGSYTIVCAGARGGNGGAGSSGTGAIMSGTFSLTSGSVLKILVGQQGVSWNNGSSSGGGGTFVTDSNNTPLIVAGGGGGNGNLNSGTNAVTGTNANAGNSGGGGGTTSGGGAGSNVNFGGGGGGGVPANSNGGNQMYGGGLAAGGGAGFGGNGGVGGNDEINSFSFLNGGFGGYRYLGYYGSSEQTSGGFGGGGNGTNYSYQSGGGGGGGYTGGGGGDGLNNGGGGGGGGSYNSGSNQTNSVGNASNGYVTITPNFTNTTSSDLYSFTSHTFTNAGATGKTGPALSTVRSAYSSASWAQDTTNNYLNMTTQGIQLWKVPTTGSYTIRAAGAAGGAHSYAVAQGLAENGRGGYGALIVSNFNLTKDQVIKIIVGQKGEDNRVASGDVDNAAPGGGGGTYVYVNEVDAFPLIAAGGGAGGSKAYSSNKEANTITDGKPSQSFSNGGTGGNGGRTNAGGNSYWAGGGSGWLTDGTGGNNGTNYSYFAGESGAYGGRAPRNGAFGGIRWIDGLDEGGDGGFGGGGGGGSDNMGTGGGGGFSGGGGANSDGADWNPSGGGGGSYSSGVISESSVTNTGHGYVTITLQVSTVAPTLSWSNITKNFNDSAFTITAPTSNSGGSFTYTSSNTSVATISGTTVTIVAAGVTTITATQAASGNYTSGSTTTTLTVNAIAPSFNTFSAITKNFNDSAFTVSASSNSSGSFTYVSNNTGIATISGTTVTIVAAGSTTITANQAASGNYTSGSTSTTLTINPIGPTITNFNMPAKYFGNPSFSIITNAHTNLYIRTGGSDWQTRIINNDTSYTNIQYWSPDSQWYDLNTAPQNEIALQFRFFAAYVTTYYNITSATVPVLLGNGNMGNYSFTYNGGTSYTGSFTGYNVGAQTWNYSLPVTVYSNTLVPTSNSSGSFSYTSSNTSVATISGNSIIIVGGGSTTITANQAAAGNYTTGSTTALLTVSPISPTFSWTNITKNFGDAIFTITPPNSNSSGSFTYTSSNTSVATITNSDIFNSVVVTLPTARTAIHNLIGQNLKLLYQYVGSSMSASAFHTACDNQGPTLTVVKASNGAIALAYASVSWASVNSWVAATSGTCWLCPFQTSDSASPNTTLYYNTIYPHLSMYDGDSYGPTFGNGHDLVISSSCYTNSGNTYQTPTNGLFNNGVGYQNFTLASFEVYRLGNGSSGTSITILGAGSTTITASQASTTNYTSGSTTTTLTVYTIAPTLTSFNAINRSFNDPAFTITPPTSNSSGSFSYTSSNTVVATITNTNTVNIIGAGSCTITANQAASGNYAIGSTTATLTVSPIAPTLSNFSIATKNFGDATFTITPPTSNSSGSFTYTSSNTSVAIITNSDIFNSVVATLPLARTAIHNLIGQNLKLLYQYVGSSMSASAFHTACDNQGPTLTVVKESNGAIALAYASASWTSINNYVNLTSGTCWLCPFQTSDSANPNTTLYYNTIYPQYSMYDSSNHGPTFGNGFDLTISSTCYTNFSGSGYQAPPNGLFNNGTTGGQIPFTLASFEVYRLGNGTSGTSIAILGAGSTTITAIQASTTNYTTGTTTTTLTVNPVAAIFNTFSNIVKILGESAFRVTATSSNSSGAITYSSNNGSVASISDTNLVTLIGVGTATITATIAATTNHLSGTTSMTLTVNTNVPTIGPISTSELANKTFGNSSFTITQPTSNSAGTFTYSSSNTSVASFSGNTITIVGAGSTTIIATQAASGFYLSSSVNAVLTVAKAIPIFSTFSNITKSYTDTAFRVIATTIPSNSPGLFSYLITNSAIASISDTNLFTIQGTGTTTITARIAETSNYLTADTTATLTVNTSNPTIGSLTIPSKTFGDASFIITHPTSNSPGTFSYTSSNTSVANVLNSGENLYSIINPSIPTLSLNNFPVLGLMSYWEMNIRFTVTGGSGTWRALIGDMRNSVTTDRGWGIWVSNSNSLHFSWNSPTWEASPIVVSLNTDYILKINRTPTSLTFLLTNVSTNGTQTATNSNISQYVMSTNGPVTIGGWINFTSENFPGTISYVNVNDPIYSYINIVGAGSTTITANQASTGNFNIGSVSNTLSVARATTSISSITLPIKKVGDPQFSFSASTSNNTETAIVYSSSNTSVATVSGTTITIVGGGLSTISASQVQTANYTSRTISTTFIVIGLDSEYPSVNLYGANLAYSNFFSANFTNANLATSNLYYANLFDCDMFNADLSGTNLEGVISGNIRGIPILPASYSLINGYIIGPKVSLQNANLVSQSITNANLFMANLTNATLINSNFTNTNLISVNLTNANIYGSNLTNTDITLATLNGIISGQITGSPSSLPANYTVNQGYIIGPYVNVSSSFFTNGSFINANLFGANVNNSSLISANLSGSNLTNATFLSGNLTNAILTNTNLTNTNLGTTIMNGVISIGITGTPASLPSNYSTISGYIIGPYVNLSSTNLGSINITNSNIFGANVTNAIMSGITLNGVISGSIIGIPSSLPTNYNLLTGYIVGPYVNLTNANVYNSNFTNANILGATVNNINLSNATLNGLISGQLTGLPFALPTNYITVSGYFIGPNVNLTNASLTGADLTNANIYGATVTNASMSGTNLIGLVSGELIGTPFSLPSDYSSISGYIIGPRVNLTDANLITSNLTNSNIFGATVTNAILLNSTLNGLISGSLNGTPASLPTNYTPISGYIIGPYVNLTSASLSTSNLTNSNIYGATINNTNLSSATLVGLISGQLIGTPLSLTTGYSVNTGYIIGPSVNLTNAGLANSNVTNANLQGATITNTNLSNATLNGLISGALIGSTTLLPSNYKLIDGFIVGPSVNLTNANLINSNLQNQNIYGATITGANLLNSDIVGLSSGEIIGDPSALPTAYSKISGYIIGPYVNLSSALLTTANLTNANIYGVSLQNAVMTNADLTGVISGSITGTPNSLPTNYTTIDGYIIGPRVNLTAAVLATSNLTNANIYAATVTNANLSSAVLNNIISGAINGLTNKLPLDYSIISGYIIGPKVNLTSAVLTNANLTNSNIHGATITNSVLTNTNLDNVITGELVGSTSSLPINYQIQLGYLIGPYVNLVNAFLSTANLVNANIFGANLINANLITANMTHANINASQITNIHLTNAKLNNVISGELLGETPFLPQYYEINTGYIIGPFANLSGADLSSSDLTNSNIYGCNLNDVNLSNAILDNLVSGQNNNSLQLALPTNYNIISGYIIGPNVNLTGANLFGSNLTNANVYSANITNTNFSNSIFNGLISGNITTVPSQLPNQYSIKLGYIVGPFVSLISANLQNVNLTNANIIGIDISGANFSNVIFNGISSGSIIGNAASITTNYSIINGYIVGPYVNLFNSNLNGADLTNFLLTNSNMRSSNLAYTTLTNTDLQSADLYDVKSGSITGTPLFPTSFSLVNGYIIGPNVNLYGANLVGANLTNVTLMNANMINSDISSAIIINAQLDGANLINANIVGANLYNTTFISSNLHASNLENTYIINTNFTNAEIKNAEIQNISFTNIQKLQLQKNINNRDITEIQITTVPSQDIISQIPDEIVEDLPDLSETSITVLVPVNGVVNVSSLSGGAFYIPSSSNEQLIIGNRTFASNGNEIRDTITNEVVTCLKINNKLFKLVPGSLIGIEVELDSSYQLNGLGLNTILDANNNNSKWINNYGNIYTNYTNMGVGVINPSYKIHTSGQVGATGYVTTSDQRLKSNVHTIDDNSAINIVRLLSPKTYEYIDKVNNKSDTVYGFLAQEVSQVLPYSVDTISNFIPNLYTNVIIGDNVVYCIDRDIEFIIKNPNSVIYIKIYKSNQEIICRVANVINNRTFTIIEQLEDGPYLLYGQMVDDFQTLKKDAIFTVSVAAMQEIDRIQSNLVSEVINCRQKNQELRTRLTTLETIIGNLMNK